MQALPYMSLILFSQPIKRYLCRWLQDGQAGPPPTRPRRFSCTKRRHSTMALSRWRCSRSSWRQARKVALSTVSCVSIAPPPRPRPGPPATPHTRRVESLGWAALTPQWVPSGRPGCDSGRNPRGGSVQFSSVRFLGLVLVGLLRGRVAAGARGVASPVARRAPGRRRAGARCGFEEAAEAAQAAQAPDPLQLLCCELIAPWTIWTMAYRIWTKWNNTDVTTYYLISQAGWNRCNLSIYLSILL